MLNGHVAMTDPQRSAISRDAPPHGSEDRALAAPAISITNDEGGGRRHEVAEATSLKTHAYVARAADGANLQELDRNQAPQSQYSSAGQQFAISDTTTREDEFSLAGNSAGADFDVSRSSPSLGIFSSQEWIAPFGPYLDFAPQPIYEPTGELVHEETGAFHEFDSPISIKSSVSVLSAGTRGQSSISPNGSEISVIAHSNPVFVRPPLPKSALKRKRDQGLGTSVEQGSEKQQRGPDHPNPPARSVSFERMSRPSPPPAREGSASSDLPPGQSSNTGDATNMDNRRNRQYGAPGSTPRATANAPSAAPHPTRSSRGGRSGSNSQIPPVLPPEKVFPIQIGSELFRLSGASISSDGKCFAKIVHLRRLTSHQHRRTSHNSSKNRFE